MRGKTPVQTSMLALVSLESMIPPEHPLRKIKPIVDDALRQLSPTFDAMYADGGRPSVPPERLLKAMVLMALYSVRSERLFCEQLGYNMLFRWFLDMGMTESAFVPTVFTHNRERLIDHEVGRKFFTAVVEHARGKGWLSSDHFSVDGTLIEAWASTKSFRPKDEETGDNNGYADFKGTKRSNDTHESKTDPEAKLYRKGRGREAKLSYMAHTLMENRSGLLLDAEVTQASGTAEPAAAITMIDRERSRREKKAKQAKKKSRKAGKAARRGRRMTVAADKGYDTRAFVQACRDRNVTPHVAQNQHARRSSAVDGRTTRHSGYQASTVARRLVEKPFGWAKTVGGLRRSRFRGLERTSEATLIVCSTYNLVRIAKLGVAM